MYKNYFRIRNNFIKMAAHENEDNFHFSEISPIKHHHTPKKSFYWFNTVTASPQHTMFKWWHELYCNKYQDSVHNDTFCNELHYTQWLISQFQSVYNDTPVMHCT